MTPESYCRDLEAYLCRKNDGHLVRIVGPGFDRVCDWATQGIPFSVACQGIDRYFERYYRRGPRRRPVRIEFCEADVLDAFDAWRRAVGVQHEAPPARPRPSLAQHLERVIARLTALRGSGGRTRLVEALLEDIARELDLLLPGARALRGRARDEVLTRLAALDRRLMHGVMTVVDEAMRAAALNEADDQLAPFRSRLSPEAYEQARAAAAERYVREQWGLPVVTLE